MICFSGHRGSVTVYGQSALSHLRMRLPASVSRVAHPLLEPYRWRGQVGGGSAPLLRPDGRMATDGESTGRAAGRRGARVGDPDLGRHQRVVRQAADRQRVLHAQEVAVGGRRATAEPPAAQDAGVWRENVAVGTN